MGASGMQALRRPLTPPLQSTCPAAIALAARAADQRFYTASVETALSNCKSGIARAGAPQVRGDAENRYNASP